MYAYLVVDGERDGDTGAGKHGTGVAGVGDDELGGADEPAFLQANPFAQVPVLELDDGNAMVGSALICAYLDSFSGRAAESVKLMEWGFGEWQVKPLYKAGASVGEASFSST